MLTSQGDLRGGPLKRALDLDDFANTLEFALEKFRGCCGQAPADGAVISAYLPRIGLPQMPCPNW